MSAGAGDAPGSREALDRLCGAYWYPLYAFVRRQGFATADAEDLTQDVFVRVFKSINTFQPGTLEGWLHRITTNLFLDQARRRQRIRMDALSAAPDHVWGSASGPEELHLDGELDADVDAALRALSPEQRVAVVLCDIEGLSYEEIAAVLDVKLGTVRSRIARGRAALREALAHRAPTGDRTSYAGV